MKKRLGILIICLCLLLGISGCEQKQEAEKVSSVSKGTAFSELSGDFHFQMLDVGQGLSVLMESDGQYLLYDGGPADHSSFVVSYLKKEGVKKLDYVIASHFDADHISGLIGVLNVFECDEVLTPDYETDTETYDSFYSHLTENGARELHPKAGDSFTLGQAKIEVVGPLKWDYEEENDRSIAIRVTYGETHYLICGDAEAAAEQDMLSCGEELQSDLYVASHHGSAYSGSEAFLKKVSPGYALISCGACNFYGHPAEQTMERLKAQGCLLYRTDKQGSILLSSDGKKLRFEQTPCEDWSSGVIPDSEDESLEKAKKDTSGSENTEATGEYSYICNRFSKKIHRPECQSVLKMSERNKRYTNESVSQLEAEGYEPCQNCKP